MLHYQVTLRSSIFFCCMNSSKSGVEKREDREREGVEEGIKRERKRERRESERERKGGGWLWKERDGRTEK